YWDAVGASMGFSEQVTIQLGYTGCWMHNPLAPTGAVKVRLVSTAGELLSRPVPGEVVRPKGRRVGVVVAGRRQGLADGVFDVYVPDLESADKVQAFLGTQTTNLPPVICIRMGIDHRKFRVRSPLFLSVFDIAEEGVDLRWDGEATIQRIVGEEAAR